MGIRLFAADIDRTLLRPPLGERQADQMPTERVLDGRRRLRAAGITFAVVSTRSEDLVGFSEYLTRGAAVRTLEPDAYILDGGATQIGPVKSDGSRDIKRYPLSAERLSRIAEAIGPRCLELYYTARYQKHTPQDLVLNDITEEAPSFFAVFEGTEEDDDDIRHLLANDPELAMHFNSMDGSPTVRCVQITDKQGTKKAGLRWLMEQCGVSPKETACIGDGSGDRDFIAEAGLPFAMGGGHPSLLTIPGVITVPTVEADGVAVAMEHVLTGAR